MAGCITTAPRCRVDRRRHQMQDVHIICSKWEQLQSMVQALEEQFEAQKEEVTILDWGTSYKKEAGYIVVEWDDEVDAAFIDQLTADNDVEDFSIYTVPCITDGQLCILEQAPIEAGRVHVAQQKNHP